MRVPNLVPIGPQAATCRPIRPEGYTHRHTHTLLYRYRLLYIIVLSKKHGLSFHNYKPRLLILFVKDTLLAILMFALLRNPLALLGIICHINRTSMQNV